MFMTPPRSILGSLIEEPAYKTLTDWMLECIKEKADVSASGGRFTYHITPGGLGVTVKVSDFYTKKEIDLTDYESW